MKIEVLYFAQFRDCFGVDREWLQLQAGGRVADALRLLESRPQWPAVASVPLRYAVNERIVSGEHELADGDRLALLSPVSGG